MKIAIDTSPLYDANSTRGVGMYTKQLLEGLSKIHDTNQYIQVQNPQELEKVQADLIHYPFFDLFFPTLPAKKQTPVMVTVHDVTPLVLPELFPPGIKGKIKLFFQKKNLQKVDKIITDSLCSKRDISKYLGIPSEKIETVYLAADKIYKREESTQKLQEIKEKYNLPEKYIIKVGDINKHKNFYILFDAMTRINPDIHLVLVGKALDKNAPKLPELQEIEENIQNFSLQKRVHRLGFVSIEDMPSLYTLAKATIFNSLYEGFGLPALESMMCKTPVVAANTGSLPEIVGTSGILINPHDPDNTASAIEQIFALDNEIYKSMQSKSYEQSTKFSLEKMTRETIDVYESLQ
jgi:glycosyltransferase involved in cell wall biosynthesis